MCATRTGDHGEVLRSLGCCSHSAVDVHCTVYLTTYLKIWQYKCSIETLELNFKQITPFLAAAYTEYFQFSSSCKSYPPPAQKKKKKKRRGGLKCFRAGRGAHPDPPGETEGLRGRETEGTLAPLRRDPPLSAGPPGGSPARDSSGRTGQGRSLPLPAPGLGM